jgi:hypothetical protein
MDAARIDRLARALAAIGTRRGLLALLTAMALPGVLLTALRADADAAGRRKTRRQRRNDGKPKREACIPTGQRCPSKKPRGKKRKKLSCNDCCQRRVTTNAKGKRVCSCTPNGQLCTETRQCCSGVCTGDFCNPATPVPPPIPGCSQATPCPGNQICVDGACEACDVCAGGCPFSSVQAAIAAADPGATIAICAGTYVENVTIESDLTLIGAGDAADAASNTILRGTGTIDVPNSAVTITPNAAAVTLRALRITNGFDELGGGVCHEGPMLTMIDCTLTGNTAFAEGGGICNDFGGTAFLTGCTISGNFAVNSGTATGGGIHNGGMMTLTDCEVIGNTADLSGGGIYNDDDAQLVLRDPQDPTSVTGNTAGTEGGGIFNNGGTVELEIGSTVSGNAVGGSPSNCVGGGYDDPGGGCGP